MIHEDDPKNVYPLKNNYYPPSSCGSSKSMGKLVGTPVSPAYDFIKRGAYRKDLGVAGECLDICLQHCDDDKVFSFMHDSTLKIRKIERLLDNYKKKNPELLGDTIDPDMPKEDPEIAHRKAQLDKMGTLEKLQSDRRQQYQKAMSDALKREQGMYV